MANVLATPVSEQVLDLLRAKRPRAFKCMTDLCSCALAECRAFQALAHENLIGSVSGYEEYTSPPFACKRDDCEGLYEDLVHEAVQREIGAESVACDLGIDCMENGMSVSVETESGSTLTLKVEFDEFDVQEDVMALACETATDIGFRKGRDNPSNGDYSFISFKCTMSSANGSNVESDEEDEAMFTESESEDDDDDDDDDFVPSSPEAPLAGKNTAPSRGKRRR